MILQILQSGRDQYAVAIGESEDTGSHRITPFKYGGSWSTVKTFPMSESSIEGLVTECHHLLGKWCGDNSCLDARCPGKDVQ